MSAHWRLMRVVLALQIKFKATIVPFAAVGVDDGFDVRATSPLSFSPSRLSIHPRNPSFCSQEFKRLHCGARPLVPGPIHRPS